MFRLHCIHSGDNIPITARSNDLKDELMQHLNVKSGNKQLYIRL